LVCHIHHSPRVIATQIELLVVNKNKRGSISLTPNAEGAG
jgi:hypothetical protein